MSTLSWLFPSRRTEPSPIDGAVVLDRLEARLGSPLRGEARLVVASELETAVSRILEQPSASSAAFAAHREGTRIAALLPRPFAARLGALLADELARSHRPDADTARRN